MRALPQIDLPPQPAPAMPEANTRANERGGNEDFATALQRRSASNDKPADETKPADKPEPKSEPTAAKPKEEPKDHDAPTPDDAAPAAAVTTPVVTDEGTPDASVMAALAAMTMPAAIVAETPIITDDATLLPSTVLPGAQATTPATATTTITNLPIAPLTADTLPVAGATTDTETAPTLSATSAAPLATAPVVATAEVATIASTAPVASQNTTPVAAKSVDQAIVPTTTNTKTTEVPTDAALPPVTAKDDAAKTTTAPPTTTPSLAALPTTQPTAMHAVAAAIGERQAKAEAAAETTTTQTKSFGDAIAQTPLAAPTPAPTPTKPLSETVLAQNQLAQQGNAMEKSVSQQVSKAMIQNLPNGDRMMVVRLTPPELGTVKIEVVERQGVFSARLHAEDDGVRLALERFLPAMRQDLRASDAPIRELNLSDQAGFHRSFEGDPQQQQRQEANNPNQRRERDDLPRFSLDGVAREPLAVPRAAPLGGRVGASWVDARA